MSHACTHTHIHIRISKDCSVSSTVKSFIEKHIPSNTRTDYRNWSACLFVSATRIRCEKLDVQVHVGTSVKLYYFNFRNLPLVLCWSDHINWFWKYLLWPSAAIRLVCLSPLHHHYFQHLTLHFHTPIHCYFPSTHNLIHHKNCHEPELKLLPLRRNRKFLCDKLSLITT